MILSHLYKQVDDAGDYNTLCRMRWYIVANIMHPEIAYIEEIIKQIIFENSKLTNNPYQAIRYKNQTFNAEVIDDGSQKDWTLDPSLHARMDTVLLNIKSATELITLTKNYVTALLKLDCTVADATSMIMPSMIPAYKRAVESYQPHKLAVVWLREPTLPQEVRERFIEQQQAPVLRMKILQLNKLTS